jgi:hypothetical protein
MTGTRLSCTILKLLPLGTTLALMGCWTAPVANVQPEGEPRLIQGAIFVESVRPLAAVQSVDPNSRTIVLLTPGAATTSGYKAAPSVRNLDRIKAGDKVRATVAEELTVYVLRDGQLTGADGAPQRIRPDAKVLSVDPSYRLLTVQYPDGQNETFKVGPEVKLRQMQAGDDVVIRTVELVALSSARR